MLLGAEYHHFLPYLPSCADAIRLLFVWYSGSLPPDRYGHSRYFEDMVFRYSRDTLLNSYHSYSPAHAALDVVCGLLPPRRPQSIRTRRADVRSASALRLPLSFRHRRQHKSAAMTNRYRVSGTAPNLTSSRLSAQRQG